MSDNTKAFLKACLEERPIDAAQLFSKMVSAEISENYQQLLATVGASFGSTHIDAAQLVEDAMAPDAMAPDEEEEDEEDEEDEDGNTGNPKQEEEEGEEEEGEEEEDYPPRGQQ